MGRLARFKEQGQRNRTSKREKELYLVLKQLFPLATFWTEFPLHDIIPDCNNNSLRVDIYCQTFNIIFEMDGEMHSQAVVFNKDSEDAELKAHEALKEQKERDSYKNKLCREADVKLIRIPYNEWDKLKTDDDKRAYIYEKL